MFNNIGKKIKIVAKVFFWIFTVISIIAGISIIVAAASTSARYYNSYYGLGGAMAPVVGSTVLSGVLIMILGPLFSWLANIVLYGFGELIERATSIDNKIPSNGTVPPQNIQGGYNRPVTQPVMQPNQSYYNGNPASGAPNNFANQQNTYQPASTQPQDRPKSSNM